MDRLQSRVIDLLRYPLAVLVVMCHCGFLSGGGTAVQIFFSETLPHVAVPLFLLFSGYLFFKEGRFDGPLPVRWQTSRLQEGSSDFHRPVSFSTLPIFYGWNR